jgi:hypothetical protein
MDVVSFTLISLRRTNLGAGATTKLNILKWVTNLRSVNLCIDLAISILSRPLII